MDIGLLTQSDTADCVIVDPATGEQTDIVITVYGQDSTEYRAALVEAARQVSKDEDNEDRAFEFLAKLTKSWVSVERNGKKLPCNKKNAVIVYSTCGTIRKQVDRFIADSKNFMPPRSTD
jgi:hypothetical protein